MESSIIRVMHGKQIFKETIAMASLSKSIRKELGYPISSEPGQLWWVYMNSENVLIGFCSAIFKDNEVHFCHDYIYPEFRNKGLYDKLFNERIDCKEIFTFPITAVATPMSLNTYIRYGFEIIKQSKNYTWLRKEQI